MLKLQILLILLKIRPLIFIWPPSYKIHLTDEKSFIISEIFSDDSNYDEDEMIKKHEVQEFLLDNNERKYYRLHKQAKYYNKKEDLLKKYNSHLQFKFIKEINFDMNESLPWEAGYIDKKGNYIRIDNKNVLYSNAMTKALQLMHVHKREENNTNATVEYDYAAMKAEYYEEIEDEKQLNETANFAQVKDIKTTKNTLQKMVDFKTKNCTAEEVKGIGFVAIKCFWMDFKNIKTRQQKFKLFIRMLKLIIVWFCIYLVIAIPCWCQKGWCCCCFRCKFCKPRQIIDEAKVYLINNPPGVYSLEGTTLKYGPTEYEINAYNKLSKALMEL